MGVGPVQHMAGAVAGLPGLAPYPNDPQIDWMMLANVAAEGLGSLEVAVGGLGEEAAAAQAVLMEVTVQTARRVVEVLLVPGLEGAAHLGVEVVGQMALLLSMWQVALVPHAAAMVGQPLLHLRQALVQVLLLYLGAHPSWLTPPVAFQHMIHQALALLVGWAVLAQLACKWGPAAARALCSLRLQPPRQPQHPLLFHLLRHAVP